MKRNMWKRLVAVGTTIGMLATSMPVMAFDEEMIVEDDSYIVTEDKGEDSSLISEEVDQEYQTGEDGVLESIIPEANQEEDIHVEEDAIPLTEQESDGLVQAKEQDVGDDYDDGISETIESELIPDFVTGELEGQSYSPDKTDLEEDLFEGYLQAASDDGTIAVKRKAGNRLTGINKTIYTTLSEYIQQVASGERASTVFEIAVEDLGMEQLWWTASELGVTEIVVDGELSEEAQAALGNKGQYDFRLIMNALLADNPYSLYWYDKTAEIGSSGYSVSTFYNDESEEYEIGFEGVISFPFPVAEEYSAGEYLVDIEIGKSIQQIVENAKAIVSQYAGLSDYEKLEGYRQKICDLVAYNHAAVDNDASYGNPWQLIWVFDNDPSTNVVCEGYSKAFQYLCDLTSFSGSISCITVTGTMSGGTGAGEHMWNLVQMEDGNNYLVDVTNCDESSIGADDLLFLAGKSEGTWDTSYAINCNGETIHYAYDEVTMSVYLQEELQLCAQRYVIKTEVITQGDLQFEIIGSKAKVIGYIGAPVDVVIPDIVNGVPVTSIGSVAFDRCESLRSIDIPGTVVSIDDGNYMIAENYEYGPFFECKNLEKVVLHEGLEYIGYLAFRFCEKLSEIELPESINFVAPLVFSNCKSLTAIQIPQNLHFLSNGMFDACWNLREVKLHDGIEVLAKGAFNDCRALEYITLNEGLKEIGDGCFSTCVSLKEIDIPDTVTYIGEGTFMGCNSIKCIDIPEGITVINDKTFDGMDELLEVNMPSSLEVLGNNVFAYSQKIHDITIPANVSVIGSHCFEGCNELRRIVFEGALPTTVPEDFLYDFIGIIYYPEELSHWSSEDYKDYQGHPVWCANGKEKDTFVAGECNFSVGWELTCDGELIISGVGDMPSYNSPQDLPWSHYLYLITGLTINEGVTSICDYCAMATRELKEVTLPKTLKTIGIYSFSGTRSLTRINLPNNLESIGENAFEGSHIENISIPSSVNIIEDGVFANCQYLKKIEAQENSHYLIKDDILYSGDYSVLIACLPSKEGPVIINDRTQRIGKSAFYNCKGITEITLPESVFEICDFAFYGCESLTKINLNCVEKMAQAAFQGCSQLQEVVFSNSIITIPYHAFAGCDNYKEITLPQSIKSIQYNAFGSYESDNKTTVLFEGNLPEIEDSFTNRKLVVKYPQNVSSWDRREEYFSEETVFIGYEHKEHVWNLVTTEPTCTEPGIKSIHCSVCGVLKEGSEEEIPALGHTWDDGAVTTAATCIEAGVKTYTCSRCEETKTEEIPANGHSWDEGAVTKAPTCTDTGIKTYTCSVCEETKTETIPANGHSWNEEATVDKEPTCTELGSKSIHCSVCNAVKEGSEEEIPALGHAYDSAWEWSDNMESATLVLTCSRNSTHVVRLPGDVLSEITIDATYIQEGEKTYTASVEYNGQTYEDRQPRVIPSLNPYGTTDDGFAWEVKEGVLTVTLQDDAQSTGMPDYATADDAPWSKAAKELNATKIVVVEGITKIGTNAFTGLESVSEINLPRSLTELAEGSLDESVLGTVKINYAGSKSEWDSLTQGTALNGVEITSTHTHNWDSGKVTKAATTAADGIKTFTCTDCGETKTEVIPIIEEQITISKKPSIKKPAAAKGKITVKWSHFKHTSKKTKAIWKKIKKVQIQCATDKGFTNVVKTATIGKSKTKYTIKGLSKKTTYYVRVRYYDGTGYSNWSGVKKIKTK